MYDYDLFVIGAGPGGLSAAKRAAKYGANVAIAEANHLGGTCANLGCIPKKLMVYAADFADWFEASKGYGWQGEPPLFDWQRFVTARNQELDRLRQSHQNSLHKANVNLFQGRAKLLDLHTIEVADQKVTANKILIATGGKPIKPDIPGIEHALTSDQMFNLKQLPKRVAMLGAGYIGVEFASVLRGFGSEVFLMNKEDCILHGFDQSVSQAVREGLLKRGIHNFCNTTIDKIIPVNEGLTLTLSNGETIVVDTVLCAIGRSANLENLGLEQLDVEMDQKAIAVDVHSRTSQSHIFAVGDCTNRKQLTPVARSEGRAFADTQFGDYSWTVDYASVPSAVCARPEAASIGLTESQAQEKLGKIRCYQTEFKPLFHSLSGQDVKMLIKLVTDEETDQVIGLHIVGDNAAEIIQGFVLAMQQGITKQDFDRTIGIHPSSAEELFTIA
ncbi:glutathione-disulfide reductase [Phormidesmis sp. 146-35]